MSGEKRDLGAVRVGSACSGYGGLEMGLLAVLPGTVVWHAENDPHASKVLDVRFPGVPNLGDLTKTDWHAVPPVDIFCAGFPCQDISPAGHRAGIVEGNRSGLWFTIADAIGVLRPRMVLLENVAAIVSRRPGLDVVLASLATLGFDAEWVCLRAADAGGCHGRDRWFCLATNASSGSLAGLAAAGYGLFVPAERGDEPAPDASGQRHGRGQDGRSLGRVDREDAGEAWQRERSRPLAGDRGATAPADAAGDRRNEGWPEPAWELWRPHAAVRCDAACAVDRDWRTADGDDYGPAIRRWHDLTRCVPEPTEPHAEGRRRLNPRFTEWMQGLPGGHVTDVLPRNPALRALGNGVVPQQAAMAVRALLPRALAVAA